jgi:hypothetical protein
MALKIWDFDSSIFFWVSVTFKDFSYDMLPKKINFILNFPLLKKGSSAKIHACEFRRSIRPFSQKLCFWSEILFQKKYKWEEGRKWKYKFQKEGKAKKGKGGNYLDDAIMRGYPPLNPFLPCRNNVNLYLHMVPKYTMRKIHPSKNGGGLAWTFPFGIFFFGHVCVNLH